MGLLADIPIAAAEATLVEGHVRMGLAAGGQRRPPAYRDIFVVAQQHVRVQRADDEEQADDGSIDHRRVPCRDAKQAGRADTPMATAATARLCPRAKKVPVHTASRGRASTVRNTMLSMTAT